MTGGWLREVAKLLSNIFNNFLGCPTFDPEIGTSCFSFYLISLFIKDRWCVFHVWSDEIVPLPGLQIAGVRPFGLQTVQIGDPLHMPQIVWVPPFRAAKALVILVDSRVTSCICVQSILSLYFQYALLTFEQNRSFGTGIQRRWVAFPGPSFRGKISTEWEDWKTADGSVKELLFFREISDTLSFSVGSILRPFQSRCEYYIYICPRRIY